MPLLLCSSPPSSLLFLSAFSAPSFTREPVHKLSVSFALRQALLALSSIVAVNSLRKRFQICYAYRSEV